MKIKEISDNRKDLSTGISKMENQLKGFREQKFKEMQHQTKDFRRVPLPQQE